MALFSILVNPPQGSIENNINNSCFPIHALHLYTAKTTLKQNPAAFLPRAG